MSHSRNNFIGLHADFVGFSASLLCAVHCIALPFLLSFTPLMGLRFLENPLIEASIILLTFIVASYAIAHGYRRHHKKPTALLIVAAGFLSIIIGHVLHTAWAEIIFSAIGGTVIATAHVVNWMHIRQTATKCRCGH
jgi:O-antigen/teichoic acid export membrane protein